MPTEVADASNTPEQQHPSTPEPVSSKLQSDSQQFSFANATPDATVPEAFGPIPVITQEVPTFVLRRKEEKPIEQTKEKTKEKGKEEGKRKAQVKEEPKPIPWEQQRVTLAVKLYANSLAERKFGKYVSLAQRAAVESHCFHFPRVVQACDRIMQDAPTAEAGFEHCKDISIVESLATLEVHLADGSKAPLVDYFDQLQAHNQNLKDQNLNDDDLQVANDCRNLEKVMKLSGYTGNYTDAHRLAELYESMKYWNKDAGVPWVSTREASFVTLGQLLSNQFGDQLDQLLVQKTIGLEDLRPAPEAALNLESGHEVSAAPLAETESVVPPLEKPQSVIPTTEDIESLVPLSEPTTQVVPPAETKMDTASTLTEPNRIDTMPPFGQPPQALDANIAVPSRRPLFLSAADLLGDDLEQFKKYAQRKGLVATEESTEAKVSLDTPIVSETTEAEKIFGSPVINDDQFEILSQLIKKSGEESSPVANAGLSVTADTTIGTKKAETASTDKLQGQVEKDKVSEVIPQQPDETSALPAAVVKAADASPLAPNPTTVSSDHREQTRWNQESVAAITARKLKPLKASFRYAQISLKLAPADRDKFKSALKQIYAEIDPSQPGAARQRELGLVRKIGDAFEDIQSNKIGIEALVKMIRE
jgi:hypothetical protein